MITRILASFVYNNMILFFVNTEPVKFRTNFKGRSRPPIVVPVVCGYSIYEFLLIVYSNRVSTIRRLQDKSCSCKWDTTQV